MRVAKDYRRRAERPAGIALRGLWAGASTRSTTRRRRQQRRRTMASIDVAAACGGGRRGGGGGGGGGDGGKEVAAAAAAAAEGGREAQQSSRGQRQPRRAKPKEKCARQSAAESALHTAASTRRPLRFSKVVELRWQSQLIRFCDMATATNCDGLEEYAVLVGASKPFPVTWVSHSWSQLCGFDACEVCCTPRLKTTRSPKNHARARIAHSQIHSLLPRRRSSAATSSACRARRRRRRRSTS